jgi:exoribonuclease R
MPSLHFGATHPVPQPLQEGVARLRESLGVPDGFPTEVLAEAEAAASGVVLPDADRTDLDLVTIDPPGARDLDQALHLARSGDGYVVHYAIADVAGFVPPGGALDRECHERGVTLYAPNRRTPLHPPVLSEGAASLLAGQERPALLWELTLDADGRLTRTHLVRARVRSRAQLTYAEAQRAIAAGTAPESLALLKDIGERRLALEAARGGVNLPTPEQEVVAHDGSWALEFRTTLPVEEWNAQLSLLTGIAAAELMLAGGVGILRTLPPAEQSDLDRLRHIGKGLRLRWPGAVTYPEFVRSLDPVLPTHAAMLNAATRLFRGAGYLAFDGEAPAASQHAALATHYTHCTAPLRRLVDRYSSEVCLALCSGRPVPEWVRAELPDLPKTMGAADARAKKFERGIVNLVEALVLSPHVGEVFTGTVIEVDARGGGVVQIAEPAVEARSDGRFTLGQEARVRLESVDLTTGSVRFSAV